MPDGAANDDSFFVGYARTPLRLVRFLAVLVSLVLLVNDGIALLIYRSQEARASGDWGTEGEVAYDGVLVARPYPVVLVAATPASPAHAVLLVSDGKEGAPADLGTLDGARVTVQGYPLVRDGITVLQLSRHPQASEGVRPLAPAAKELGSRTLTGEIVDSKCFLGAMIPGEGKVHEDCASLCLLGGIPPLFVTRDAAGRLTYRLLADETGGPMMEAAASRSGQFVTLTGMVRHLDGIDVFLVPRASLD